MHTTTPYSSLSRAKTLLGVLVLTILAGCALPRPEAEPAFSHHVDSVAKPWTHLNFRNNPMDFQFAIVSDRTGGHRDGIFESAVAKLNLLQPEFVITVGDMIEGYTHDTTVLNEQWDEFNGFLSGFDMPFFYVPGNHDNVNATMQQLYREKFGAPYYSFIYRNALFLCLDTQDTDPSGMTPAQVDWAVRTLQEHRDVRWTFVFMHQPLWVYEEGRFKSSRKDIKTPRSTGFARIQDALRARDYTVFAGHFHQYIKFVRESRDYFILGATGGASELRGTSFGEFDHGVWVTLTSDGPVFANLLLDGIQDKNVHSEANLNFASRLIPDAPSPLDLQQPFSMSIPVHNPFGHSLNGAFAWTLPDAWSVTPVETSTQVLPGQTNVVTFELVYAGDNPYTVLPTCRAQFTAGSEFRFETQLDIPALQDAYFQRVRPTTVATVTAEPPVIDGLLTEACWSTATVVDQFRTLTMAKPTVTTTAAISYDADSLYIAFTCDEPNMDGLVAREAVRDGAVWADDSVELFIQPDVNAGPYYQFVVNPLGTLMDGKARDSGYNAVVQSRAIQRSDGWGIEMAIPWSELSAAPLDTTTPMGLLLVRTRPQSDGISQFPPMNTGNHTPARFGRLAFEQP
ncbi:MAG: metallophosphoesterase [Verrucomicrobia bacterium]|nr:metallophosphoesterase [Verrucomicrobiota bacterium]